MQMIVRMYEQYLKHIEPTPIAVDLVYALASVALLALTANKAFVQIRRSMNVCVSKTCNYLVYEQANMSKCADDNLLSQ